VRLQISRSLSGYSVRSMGSIPLSRRKWSPSAPPCAAVVVREWDETTAGKRAVEMASKASLAVTDGGAAVLREVESVAG